MSEVSTNVSLLAYYEHKVLPALYERLDQAFPEMEWAWTGDGWKGVKKAEYGYYNRFDQTAVVCNHPWGFVTRAGSATSWLAYVNGGVMPSGSALEHAVRKLADLAGVDHSWTTIAGIEVTSPATVAVPPTAPTFEPAPVVTQAPRAPQPEVRVSPVVTENWGVTSNSINNPPIEPTVWEQSPAGDRYYTAPQDRQLDLWEAFVAFCHGCLCSERNADLQKKLQEEHGIDCHRAENLPLGVYPDAHTVAEYLRSQGFTDEEIEYSCVTADSRLAGRVIIPWRDSLGRIATIIGEDIDADEHTQGRRLYVKGGGRPAVFGLDIALRPSSCGVEHLLLVDSPMAVIYFHQHGIPNAAMIADATRTPSEQDWEILSDLGVETVTLAIGDDAHAAARTCKSLLAACSAKSSPAVFAIAFGSLETCRTPSDFGRLHGVGKFREILSNRQHLFAYLSSALVRRHRPGKRFTPSTVKSLIKEGIALDATIYRSDREEALDCFLWGEILAATGAAWEDVRVRLTHRPHHAPKPIQQTWLVEKQPSRWSSWHRSQAAKDLDWANGILQTAAEENGLDLSGFQWPPRVKKVTPVVHHPIRRIEPAYDYDDVRQRAYQLWEQKGRPIGVEQECWYEAEQSLKARPKATSNGFRVA